MLTDCNCVLALTVTDCQLSRNTQHYNSLHRCQRRCWLDRRSTANHTVVGGDLNAHNTYYVGRRTHCVYKVMGSKVKVAETFAGEAYRSTVGRQRPSCFVTLCQITEKVIDYELRPFCTLCWYFDLIAFVSIISKSAIYRHKFDLSTQNCCVLYNTIPFCYRGLHSEQLHQILLPENWDTMGHLLTTIINVFHSFKAHE